MLKTEFMVQPCPFLTVDHHEKRRMNHPPFSERHALMHVEKVIYFRFIHPAMLCP
jgi:hypothetical protein